MKRGGDDGFYMKNQLLVMFDFYIKNKIRQCVTLCLMRSYRRKKMRVIKRGDREVHIVIEGAWKVLF